MFELIDSTDDFDKLTNKWEEPKVNQWEEPKVPKWEEPKVPKWEEPKVPRWEEPKVKKTPVRQQKSFDDFNDGNDL